jgi:hypothetical protein
MFSNRFRALCESILNQTGCVNRVEWFSDSEPHFAGLETQPGAGGQRIFCADGTICEQYGPAKIMYKATRSFARELQHN